MTPLVRRKTGSVWETFLFGAIWPWNEGSAEAIITPRGGSALVWSSWPFERERATVREREVKGHAGKPRSGAKEPLTLPTYFWLLGGQHFLRLPRLISCFPTLSRRHYSPATQPLQINSPYWYNGSLTSLQGPLTYSLPALHASTLCVLT